MKEPHGPDPRGGFDVGQKEAKEGGGGTFKQGGGKDASQRESDVRDTIAFVKGKKKST